MSQQQFANEFSTCMTVKGEFTFNQSNVALSVARCSHKTPVAIFYFIMFVKFEVWKQEFVNCLEFANSNLSTLFAA